MGSAFVRTLERSGFAVTAWSRNPDHAERLASPGVTAARTLGEACDAADLLIITVSTYDAVAEILGGLGDLNGKTVINLTSGSPEQAESAAHVCRALHAEYLDGIVCVYPNQIGDADAQLLVAGSAAAWEKSERALRALGGDARYLSDSIANANTIDAGLVGAFFLPAMVAYIEAATFCLRAGISSDAVRGVLGPLLKTLQSAAEEATQNIEDGAFDDHDASITVFADAARTIVATYADSGRSGHMISAAAALLETAETRDMGGMSLAAVASIPPG
jgi:3-hydroxyisobutyrate dehydrogenase-like beta-hydroxyacid dehydrogenase